MEIDALRKEMSELQASCKRDLDHMKKEKDSLYNENLHLKDKDKSVRDWEAQITEIIQWLVISLLLLKQLFCFAQLKKKRI